jgi:hypothetical protein
MLKIYKDTIIYVLCPSGIVTGGIEAVHQLVDKLKMFGHDARIVPVPPIRNPFLLQYRNYHVCFDCHILDDERNIIITTEVNPLALKEHQNIQKAIWWLSVDFHEALDEKFDFHDPQARAVRHFVQSAYAAAFLRRKGIVSCDSLSDYLHSVYLHQVNRSDKNNVVLYTPVKGAENYIQRLKQADSSIQWLAMTGMIRKQHAQTMRQAKVYVDFGSHPGKDRQPREAVVNGCCVIVGLSGAARFEADIPIRSIYKFDPEHLDVNRILDTIRGCLVDYDDRFQDFDAYAKIVRQNEQCFEEEVKSIFGIQSVNRRWRFLTIATNIVIFSRQNNWFVVCRSLLNEFFPLGLSAWLKRVYRPTRARLLKLHH